MVELARSLIRTGWHQSLQELQRAAQSLSLSVGTGPQAEWVAEAFRAGERVQTDLLRLLEGGAAGSLWGGLADGLMRASLDVARDSAAWAASSGLCQTGRLEWLQLENKLRAFTLFQYARSEVGVDDDRLSLAELIELAGRQDACRSVWIIEGLGYDHAERAWRDGVPDGLLSRPAARAAPERSRIALHTGMGMLMAAKLLGELHSSSSDSEVGAVLDRFLALCESNSRPGCLEAAFEPLGLAVRTLQPWLTAAFDRRLSQLGPRLQGCFWHGVGRGIYFLPTGFVPWPSGDGRALELTLREPPDAWSRLNAQAGLCWALTLVNISHPEVLEDFIGQFAGRSLEEQAVAEGVGSGLVVWQHSAGQDSRAEALLAHPAATASLPLWRRLVQEPGRRALQQRYPRLRESGHFGELFHSRSG